MSFKKMTLTPFTVLTFEFQLRPGDAYRKLCHHNFRYRLVVFHDRAITWTDVDVLSTGPLRTNFSEIWYKMKIKSLMKMHLKLSSAKCRPHCSGRNESSRDWINKNRNEAMGGGCISHIGMPWFQSNGFYYKVVLNSGTLSHWPLGYAVVIFN